MAGYDGYSMSNNARSAYAYGEKPISRWTKAEIMEAIKEIAESNELNFDFGLLKKVSVKVLKSEFLTKTSWHHTSKFYNCTNFYSIDEEKVIALTDAEILKLAENQSKSEKSKKSVEEKEAMDRAKDIYDKLNIIFLSNITKLKSFGGVIKRWTSGKLDIDRAYSEALEVLKAQETKRVDSWPRLSLIP